MPLALKGESELEGAVVAQLEKEQLRKEGRARKGSSSSIGGARRRGDVLEGSCCVEDTVVGSGYQCLG